MGTREGLSAAELRWKRALDLLLVIPLLVACGPLLAALWIWVTVSSKGPGVFRQPRVGYLGRPFTMLKLRSMTSNDGQAHRQYTMAWIHRGEQARRKNSGFKLDEDPRITRVGRCLRKYSLDELPQLINVLKGEMSLVGPRPAMDYEVSEYAYWHFQRFNAPPGMTGLWQVSGRNQVTFDEMAALDVKYIRTWNVLGDLRILFQTIGVVIRGSGH